MDPLEPLDAAMITAELLSDPLHTAALLILSPPADAGPGYVDELYQEALTDTAELDPRFRRHPHVGVDTAGIWVWRTDDSIDMREHVQRRTLPAGGDREVLWQLISELHSEPLDRSRPMWMTYVIDGLAGGRFAFYIKVHHTVIDGVAGLNMIADALTTDPESRSMRPIYAIGPKQPAPPAADSPGLIPNPLSLVRSALNGVTSGLGFVRQLAVGRSLDSGRQPRGGDRRSAVRRPLHKVQRPTRPRAHFRGGQLVKIPHPRGPEGGRGDRQRRADRRSSGSAAGVAHRPRRAAQQVAGGHLSGNGAQPRARD